MEKIKMIQSQKELLRLDIQFFADGDDPKSLAAQIQSGFEELKKAAEKQETEVKKFGQATQETKDEMKKINEAMNEAKKRLDELEAKANRAYQAGQGNTEQDEEKKAQSAAFYQFMRKGRADMNPDQRKALVADSEGQILIPEELDREIQRQLPETAIFRSLVNTRNTSADKIRKRRMNEVIVGWGKIEVSTKTLADYESELNPSDYYIYIENLNGLTKIGTDELEDTDIQLQQYLSSSFAQAAAEEEDKAVLVGRGHTQEEPEGILTAANVERIMSANVGAVEADDLIKLMYALKSAHRKNGVWVMPSFMEMTIRTFKNSNGDYIWQPALTAGTPNQLLGFGTYTQDDFPDFAAGADQVVFGDFKRGYTIADRSGSTIQRLNELYIEEDLIGFKFKKRVGGGVDRPDAFKVLKIQS
ncbi:phage major capsid protein [Bacillus sp. Hm123]|uniref:phage major capsid protein n=1 Tax=Bacillus sp. Hm123 TaxID=3450745 RepID=UPI003F422B40